MGRGVVGDVTRVLLTAIGSALATALAAMQFASGQLDKREAQIQRREERVIQLEDELEECRGHPIPRGVTPKAAERDAMRLEMTP